MKTCIICEEPIHPKRIEILPNVTKCVKCSTTLPKGGVTITRGEGDHTYTETIIMEHDEYIKFQEMEAAFTGKPFDAVEEDPTLTELTKTDEDEDDGLEDDGITDMLNSMDEE